VDDLDSSHAEKILAKRTDLGLAPAIVYSLMAAHTRARSVAWRLRGGGQPDAQGFRILFYHPISDDEDELALAPERFREQMSCVADQGYRAMDVGTALQAAPGALGLAFDDGYADIALHALPELERHGFSATVFLATGVTDGRARFSWYERQPPLLSWDEVAQLDGGAFRFEAHTVTHPNLLAFDDDAARNEIAGSKRELEERLGREVTAFCYPPGSTATVTCGSSRRPGMPRPARASLG
jgi:peptidoglycan/xylan/chitin deacetylase (PgdA/CDA1 family)